MKLRARKSRRLMSGWRPSLAWGNACAALEQRRPSEAIDAIVGGLAGLGLSQRQIALSCPIGQAMLWDEYRQQQPEG